MDYRNSWFKSPKRVLIIMMMSQWGLLCTGTADTCISNPCVSESICVELSGDYLCLCHRESLWYMGKNCEELYDPCILAPCANCTSRPGSEEFTCHCPDGHTGLNCTQSGDKCQSNPCKGTRPICVDTVNSYSCHCPTGFGGSNCQEKVTVCSEDICQNGGSCTDLPNLGYQCQCAPGFKGKHCEENIDECQSQPCQNGAICVDGVDAYQCFCVPGYQGYHCDMDINECASKPCQNNGTCLDEVDQYRCHCAPGFEGINCQIEIDECEAQRCQNGATCRDHVAMYTCECVAGYQGQDCEVDVDECASNPCLNKGRCLDAINSYECDCQGTGFTGDHCEEEIEECASDPCQHGATCLEEINKYSCLCWPGYEGEHCQVDIDECHLQPCENGGECFQLSDIQSYRILPELRAVNFSYEKSDGFICRCLPGFTGDNCSIDVNECESAPCLHGGTCQDLVNTYRCICPDGFTGLNCETDINECESNPCHNGATCEDAPNSYRCHCPDAEHDQEPWGGHNCDVRLHGCIEHQCQHGAKCVPVLSEGQKHSYICICSSGWAGDHCLTSTTFSFNSEGYVNIQMAVASNRTTQDSFDHNHTLHMKLRFRSTLPDMLLLYRGTLDHFVSLEIVKGLLHAMVKANRVLQVVHPDPVSDGSWYQVSVIVDEYLLLVVKGPGCEEGKGCVSMNEDHNHLIFLQPSSFHQLFIGGAPAEYLAFTASGQGFIGCMEDLVVDHTQLLPVDLTREETKSLELGCTKKDLCHTDACSKRGQCVDMWIHARCECDRPYYGSICEKEYPSWTFGHENTTSYSTFNILESHGENFSISFLMRSLKHNGFLLQLQREEKPYLTVFLKEGTVAIYSPHTTLLSEAKLITDGNSNFVTMTVCHGHVVFPKAGNHLALGNVSIESGDVAYIGGLPESQNMDFWGGGFKGCLQDIRLDEKHLTIQVHPEEVEHYLSSKEENVLQGCQSDNTCKVDPCLNGGHCVVTWNDFECVCQINFEGKICETRIWCVDNPCVNGGECVDMQDGYECITNATFEDNALHYMANGSLKTSVTSITMDVRTRDENGILLRAGNRAEAFCLGLLNSTLLVKLHNRGSLVAFTSEITISDGAWHHIELAMADRTKFASRWHLRVDGKRVGSSNGFGDNLNFFNDTNIILAENFTGCLGEVRIGGIYLPLIRVPDPPQMSHFSRQGGHEPMAGCHGARVCESQPCLNHGECHDQFNKFHCSCSSGWEGDTCQTQINECLSSPCVYGTCNDLLAGYWCDCEPGYMGQNCQDEVDDCQEFSCINGGTCLHTIKGNTCACPPDYIGKRCQWLFPSVACSPTKICLNGGVCRGVATGGNCTCKPGYTGARCEREVNECESSPCLHGATCLDRLNHFQCVCMPGFSGTLCEHSKAEQKERIPWLAVTIPVIALCTLLVILAVSLLIVTARKKRQSEGTYSPSSQEVAGARLEMGNVLKVPPEERLI